MSKFKASLPRKNPGKGMAHYVFSIKDENGCRIESFGLIKCEIIEKVYEALLEVRQSDVKDELEFSFPAYWPHARNREEMQ